MGLVFLIVLVAVILGAGVGGWLAGGAGAFLGILAGLVIGGLASVPVAQTHYHEHTATCTVTGKDRSGSSSDGTSSMRVYTSCGVFENQDSFLRGKWNSADIWSTIKEGQTYDFKVVGWRFGFMSDFPNILSVSQHA